MSRIIGIDLGTSNSAAAIMEGGRPTIIPSAEGTSIGGKAFPSYVAFTKENELLVGEPARRQAVTNPEGTIKNIKRKMGTDYKVEIFNKQYTPQQISAFILQKIKRDTEAYLGESVQKVVITVPAYFNDNQRQATKDAGAIAGLEVVRIINEPTAAALAYGIDKTEEEQQIMVFDFGGGTLDVTIMEFSEGVFEVVSTSGDTQLGGTDMDELLMDFVVNEFKKESGIDLRNDKMALWRVREACEKAKIELSTTQTTEINLPFITADQTGPRHLSKDITRAKLEELVNPVVRRCKGPIDQALRDAGVGADKINKIIMVGGPTRMPVVQKFLETTIGKKIQRGIDPMECVAMGAAIQGAVLAGEVKDVLLLDVTPLSLSIETLGRVATRLIERNTTIPTRKSQIFSTAADNQTTVEIHVLQGEREMAVGNTSLGKFQLMGIPSAPRGIPQIEVTFDIDADGILNVSAKDLGTGKQQSITITASTKLPQDEIDRAVKEAEQYADEDKSRREKAEAVNQADSLIYSTEKTLDELGDKVTPEEKEKMQKGIEELRQALEEGEISKIKERTETLSKEMHQISSRIYQQVSQEQAQAQQQAQAEEPSGEQEGDYVDADYKIVDEE
ncbi:MAG TPA: molecular chaperone DnaK [Methanomassiliicoccales archaeon]|nr:molecular chaperone DnaK [Methanomassiliicoccales archaeon]